MTAPTAFPLAWPSELPRTKHRAKSAFKVTLSRAMADLQDALRLFGQDTGSPVRNLLISSNVALGMHRPADPGIAVYFDWDGAGRCIAIDRYDRVEDNVRAVYYVLEARRQEMRHGGLAIVRAAFKGFAALPPPVDWRSVLGVPRTADRSAAEAAYRDRAREAHPDLPGGSAERMAALNSAIAAARLELGG